ncbi:Nuclear receptor 2C2-associated protein [Vanrija pseudolonga]|uniref:Nuclear receptor 2C2-associated protein n=1 Tax=Vanrija pseudolonga TaxID=143232 RepID=A0AAF1BIX1_9TREE|nr:Nuclear receptor 2C2-associated protein [Vanrija pseudolonga]
MADLIPSGTKIQASASAPGTRRASVLAEDDEAWTAPSSPAHLVLGFPAPITPARIALTFQGGFVALSILVSVRRDGENGFEAAGRVYPEDVNRRQVLSLPYPDAADAPAITALRLDLENSSDHHGRVTLYRLELLPPA